MTNYIYYDDRRKGIEQEIIVKPHLDKFFAEELIHLTEEFSKWDYAGDNKFIELKSRYNTHDKYSNTMIGKNEIHNASKLTEDVYFVFNYTDGLYYWKYDKDVELINAIGGRKDRKFNEQKPYYYIPINLLTKIE